MKLSDTERFATEWYGCLDLHRELALPTDVVIDRQEFVELLKLVHATTPTYKPSHKMWKEVIENIKQGNRLTFKQLLKAGILAKDLIKYQERTEQAKTKEVG